jgi:hypothetical protein
MPNTASGSARRTAPTSRRSIRCRTCRCLRRPGGHGARRDFAARPRASTRPRRCARVPPPPPFGARPDTTAARPRRCQPEGVVTPDGVLVTAGPPPVLAIPRPREAGACPAHPDLQHRGRDPRHVPPRAAPRRPGPGPGGRPARAPGHHPRQPFAAAARAALHHPGRPRPPRSSPDPAGTETGTDTSASPNAVARSLVPGSAPRQHGNPDRQRGAPRAPGARRGDRGRRRRARPVDPLQRRRGPRRHPAQ